MGDYGTSRTASPRKESDMKRGTKMDSESHNKHTEREQYERESSRNQIEKHRPVKSSDRRW